MLLTKNRSGYLEYVKMFGFAVVRPVATARQRTVHSAAPSTRRTALNSRPASATRLLSRRPSTTRAAFKAPAVYFTVNSTRSRMPRCRTCAVLLPTVPTPIEPSDRSAQGPDTSTQLSVSQLTHSLQRVAWCGSSVPSPPRSICTSCPYRGSRQPCVVSDILI